jgi:hypothetical protein
MKGATAFSRATVRKYLEAARVGLKIRRVVWPSGTNRDSLVLYMHDEGAADPQRAVSYGWADPAARRLGINLRWAQANCVQQP